MKTANNSLFHEIILKLSPILDELDIEFVSSDFVWSIVLGMLPIEHKGYEDMMMENCRKDSIAEKIDNIEILTGYAEYMINEKPDFGYANLESFSQALRQLIKYVSGEPKAEKSLKKLKHLYISFLTLYYVESVKDGRIGSASKNIKYFSDKILNIDDELKTKLNELVS